MFTIILWSAFCETPGTNMDGLSSVRLLCSRPYEDNIVVYRINSWTFSRQVGVTRLTYFCPMCDTINAYKLCTLYNALFFPIAITIIHLYTLQSTLNSLPSSTHLFPYFSLPILSPSNFSHFWTATTYSYPFWLRNQTSGVWIQIHSGPTWLWAVIGHYWTVKGHELQSYMLKAQLSN